jgi:TonB-linked SusC/RagA family outer membrane protein
MNVHQPKQCKTARSILLLCGSIMIGTLALPAQTAYVKVPQSEKSPSVKINEQGAQVSLKKIFEVAYDRHKLRFVSDDELIASLRVPAAWKDLSTGRLLNELESFLKKNGLQLKKLSDQQYVIVTAPKQSKPVTIEEKKVPEQVVVIPITGMVKDKAGTLQGGVSITEKGTRNSTATDQNGLFKLNVTSEDAVLQITAVGYKTLEIKVKAGDPMIIELDQKTEDLNEVAVVGYGRQKKISVVGAQSSVKVDDIKFPVRSVKNALAGQLAGLVAVQRSGEPGFDESNVWIRGVASINNSSNPSDNSYEGGNNSNGPLVLIDGVPRSLANLNVEDIASLTILKDASATAVYGVRGANGVIIVETKRGTTAAKPAITLDFNTGYLAPTRLLKLANAPTYIRMLNEAKMMRGELPQYADSIIQKYEDGSDPYLYPNVNWVREVLKDWTNNRSANLNISGGTKLANYYVGTSYYEESGLYKTDPRQTYDPQVRFKRYTLTTNVSFQATNSTTVDLGIGGFVGTGNYPGVGADGIFNQIYITPTHLFPVKYAPDTIAAHRDMENPYEMATQRGYATHLKTELRSNVKLKQQLDFWIKGLSVQGLFAFDAYTVQDLGRRKRSYTFFADRRDPVTGNLVYTNTYPTGTNYLNYQNDFQGNRKFYSEASVNYANTFGKHDITAMVVYNRSDVIKNKEPNLIASLPFRMEGVAGRTTYAFNSKYLAELNFGYTGAENFSPAKRFGFFPSMGVGYVVSKEKFFDKLTNVIQFLKFRATWGKTGNSSIDGRRFAYIGLAATGGGYSFGTMANNAFGGNTDGEYAVNVGWETSTKTNLGFELRTLNDKLSIQADLFYDHRTDIIARNNILPDFAGVINLPFGNIGETENRGVDGTIEYAGNIGAVRFRMRGNFTFNRNKIIEDGTVPPQYPWRNTRGHKIGQRFGYISEGLFADSSEITSHAKQLGDVRPGDIRFADLNGDSVINQFDQTAIGIGTIPEIIYGFGINLSYKNFDVSAFVQGVGNVDIHLNGLTPFGGTKVLENSLAIIEDRWESSKANTNSRPFYPRLSVGPNINDNYAASTWWIANGRYLRLKNAEIGYTFPERWVRKIGFKNIRLYTNGVNLLTWSPFTIYDPELGDGKGTKYPLSKTFSAGLNVRF